MTKTKQQMINELDDAFGLSPGEYDTLQLMGKDELELHYRHWMNSEE